MTENLLQKLEEGIMVLLSEVESSRQEIQRLHHENSLLIIEKESHAKKLADIISLLDAVNGVNTLATNVIPNTNRVTATPILVQA